MQLSCPSFLYNKLFQKNRFWAFQHFQPPPLILRKNEGIMSVPCSAIKQARTRGILHEFYTPPSTIMPPLKVWGRHCLTLQRIFSAFSMFYLVIFEIKLFNLSKIFIKWFFHSVLMQYFWLIRGIHISTRNLIFSVSGCSEKLTYCQKLCF